MLTYAGVPLLFPDAEVDDFLRKNQDLLDLSQFSAAEARLASARQACRSRFEQDKGLGLPVLNWPAPPTPRLNTLYWPTGATRWARGWFLANAEAVEEIERVAYTDNETSVAFLEFGDDDAPLVAEMYLLPPRPIAATEDLFLVPLVDVRYFWQYRPVGDLNVGVDSSWTWNILFGKLRDALGLTSGSFHVPTIESAYLKPDPVEFSRRNDNTALLLDAACSSTGKRLVRLLDGTCWVEDHDTALEDYNANFEQNWQLLAGEQFDSLSPAQLTVLFRRAKQYLLRSNGQEHSVTTSAPSEKILIRDSTLAIHCAAIAEYDSTDALQNGTALTALAHQITDDFYAWNNGDFDFTFAGALDWTPNGFDDSVTWAFGRTIDSLPRVTVPADGGTATVERQAEELAFTRATSLPSNFWAELNACTDPAQQLLEPRLMAKANADIAAGAEGMVSLYDSFTHDTTKDVKLRNIGGTDWGNGLRGWAEGIGDAVWMGTPSECGAT